MKKSGETGVEPAPRGTTTQHSTIKLLPQQKLKISLKLGSARIELAATRCKRVMLPLHQLPKKVINRNT